MGSSVPGDRSSRVGRPKGNPRTTYFRTRFSQYRATALGLDPAAPPGAGHVDAGLGQQRWTRYGDLGCNRGGDL
jgi:hypothetical protein